MEPATIRLMRLPRVEAMGIKELRKACLMTAPLKLTPLAMAVLM